MKKSILPLLTIMGTRCISGCASKEETVTNNIESTKDKVTNTRDNGGNNMKNNNDSYSLRLYNGLVDKNANYVFSPYSITDCFSLVYDGVDGKSKEEIDEILGFKDRDTKFYRDYDNQVKFFDGKGIKVANKGYINNTYNDEVNKDLLDTNNIDIIAMDDKAADLMNEFISEATEDKINDLIPKDAIKDDTVAVLINALYMKKSWNFNESEIIWKPNEKTYKGFSGELGTSSVKEVTKDIDVLKLSYDGDIDYEKMWKIEGQDKIEAFKNQYDKNEYSMYIICNNVDSTEDKVDSFMEELTNDKLNELLNFDEYKGLQGYTSVNFEVPNFKVKCMNSLLNGLQKLGLKAPFISDTNDFNRLGPVHINDILHGAYVDVNEKGTEAAATTAMMMEFDEGAIIELREEVIKEVIADETFVFIIKDDTNNNILFMGRINEPTELK